MRRTPLGARSVSRASRRLPFPLPPSAARPDLIRALSYESGPAVEWLTEAFKLDLNLVGQLGAHSFPRTHRGGERFPGMSITYGLMDKFEKMCKAEPDRARLVNKANVEKLLTNAQGEVRCALLAL